MLFAVISKPLRYFYPRSPCGERPHPIGVFVRIVKFLSTLSLRRATAPPYNLIIQHAFLSTLSLRRATGSATGISSKTADFYPRSPCGERQAIYPCVTPPKVFLSTLSLRRATRETMPSTRHISHFYPRSPCGERRAIGQLQCVLGYFYPRSPCGERPWARGSRVTYVEISIHALLAESD